MKTSYIIAIAIAILIIGSIGFLGIVALIAIPNMSGVQQRSQVNADIHTAQHIGKAVEILTLSEGENVVPQTATEYNELKNIREYVSPDYEPNSLEDAEFYVVNDNGTIKVAIAKEAEDVSDLMTNEVDYDGTGAGWAYIEGSY